VHLKFNIKIGENIITTITTNSVANRIDPNTAFPSGTFFVIDKDNFGNDITVTLNELKSIELGAPITVEIIEIYAEVPWENEQYKDWSDYKASIDKTSAKIVLDTGSGVKEYRVFSGIRYPALGAPYYFMNITLENATLYTLGGEQKEDGVYIGGEKVEDWRFGFDNSTFSDVAKHLNKTNGSLLSIPIKQGWTVVMKPPDKEPPKIHWAAYTKDMKGIEAGVSDNENVKNVTAYVKLGNAYQNIILKDDDKDLVYNATLQDKITDVSGGYIIADDGKLFSTFKILPVPDIIVDDGIRDDPANHTWNTIQEGIDNANESDVIYVRNGTYKENIAIYKPLTLIGEDNNNTVIDAGNKGDAVYVKANNVQISGFKIINGKSLYPASDVEVRGEVANGSFTWTPDNFGGFWYDIDEDTGNETLKAVVNGRDIYNGNLIYTTTPQEVNFSYSNFGKYQVIGFMADKYFAGYTANTTPPKPTASVGKKSALSSGQLHKVLIDDDTKRTVSEGGTLTLKEGYVLKVKAVDVGAGPGQIWVVLLKDGNEVDPGTILAGGSTYVYTPSKVGSVSDLPIIFVYFESVFKGMEVNATFIKGIFQISETYTSVKAGNRYGAMEITAMSDNGIVMQNDYSIYLSKDSTVDIAGNWKFKVADSDTLRFYPLVELTGQGTYEIRGKVARGTKAQTWDAYSFAGFYYDMNEDIKTEKLSISGISGRTIGKEDLTYQTYSAPKYFNVYKYKGILVNGQANYSVIGWQGEKYAAVKGKANKTAKILIEQGATSAYKKTLTVGETWDIGGGWTLTAQAIDAKATPRQVWLVLSLNGVKKDDIIVQQGGVYAYVEKSLAGETDVPMFVTYVDSIFAGATTDMVQLRFTWAISPDVMLINSGDEFGKLKVVDATQKELMLKNNYAFSLDQGSIINIIGDVNFRVADSDELRYYPAKTTIPSWEGASGIKLDDSLNSVISDVNIINSSVGIRLYSAKDNQLVKNGVSADYIGIDLTDSFQNVLSNNTILSKVYGIKPEGYDKIHFNNSIDTSNKLNGKPVYYYFNEKNIALDGIDTNHLTLAYSTGFKIKNSIIGGDGINLYYSESNIISNNTFGGAGLNSNGYEEFSGIWSYKTTDHYNLTRSNYGRYNESLFGETVGFSDTSNRQYVEKPLLQATVPVPEPIGGGGGGGGKETRINLYHSDYNNITSNILFSIVLDNSYSNIVANNNASITLYNSGNNVVDSNNAFNNSIGIYLWSSSNNSLSHNNVMNNLDEGISLSSSCNNTLSENNASNNWNGISLWFSSSNSLIDNNVSNNKYYGIDLYNSDNNTLTGNTMSGNTYNFAVAGDGVSPYIQNIDASNKVGGKPVYYLVNQQNRIIDSTSNAGYAGIINSTNITIKDLTIKNEAPHPEGWGILYRFKI
jgi:S-layer protein (TIGR01567 family)